MSKSFIVEIIINLLTAVPPGEVLDSLVPYFHEIYDLFQKGSFAQPRMQVSGFFSPGRFAAEKKQKIVE